MYDKTLKAYYDPVTQEYFEIKWLKTANKFKLMTELVINQIFLF